MKKDIFLVFLSVVLGFAITLGISYAVRDTPVKVGETEHVEGIIYKEVGCPGKDVPEIKRLMGYLPPALLDKFQSKGGTIVIVNDLPGKIIGRTESTDDSIVVYIEEGYAFQSFLHEFGHVYLDFYALGEDFNKIFTEEAELLVKAYYGIDECNATVDEIEYFAQAFQTVVYLGEDTQEAAPKTFDYISGLVSDMVSE